MNACASSQETERLSELIGAVYDCAIDPDRWEQTLDSIREFLVCANSTLYVYDTSTNTQRIFKTTGVEPHWQRLMIEYSDSVSEVYQHVGDADTRPLDKIFVMRRELSDEFLRSNFYFMNWAVPQGIDDLIQVNLMRERGRLSALAMGRFAKDGPVTDREVHLMELLAPHLRRAVIISDLIDMKTIEVDALGGTLDAVAASVILVGEDGTIMHANSSAKRMFESDGPLRSVAGKISAHAPQTTARLIGGIADVVNEAPGIDDLGLGIALPDGRASTYVAHLLPVKKGVVRSRLAPCAVAALFVASSETPPNINLRPIAEAFGLTPAETRLLDHIVRGESLDQAAAALNVAKTTCRTHMARLLAKTGTHRQGGLLSLVQRLAPALQRGPTAVDGQDL